MTKREYIAEVLREYASLPHTPDRARTYDRRLAAQFHDQHVPRKTISAAFVIAIVRRSQRPASQPPLDLIRSLAYFQPIILQLLKKPLDEGYIQYMTHRYRQILADPASVPPEVAGGRGEGQANP